MFNDHRHYELVLHASETERSKVREQDKNQIKRCANIKLRKRYKHDIDDMREIVRGKVERSHAVRVITEFINIATNVIASDIIKMMFALL